jgi:hypothetical protein
MKPKQKKTSKIQVRQLVDDEEFYDDSTTITRSTNSFSSSNSNNNNSDRLTKNNNTASPLNNSSSSSDSNSNTASSFDNNTNTTPLPNNNDSITTSSIPTNIIGRKSRSKVWLYAKKSEDNQSASCQLCDFTCSVVDHSTSTIRYHLIREHDRHDLIVKSLSTSKTPQISEHLKRELHSLCYRAIIIDQCSFNDFRKNGIIDIFKKICPGNIFVF